MANLENQISNRLDRGALCLRNPGDEKWDNVINNLKNKAYSVDMCKTMDKDSINKVKGFCDTKDGKALIYMDSLYKGLENNQETIQSLVKDRKFPNGDRLPENAVLLYSSSDKDPVLQDKAVRDVVRENADMLEKGFGGMVELTPNPTKEDVNVFIDTFNTSMKAFDRDLGFDLKKN